MTKRTLLRPNCTLSLHREQDGSDSPSLFTITKLLSDQGGSSVCYLATLHGTSGILKEFYPHADAITLQRTDAGVLVPDDSSREVFQQHRTAYVHAHLAARSIPNTCNYIPYIELFYSNAQGTVYVWTPNPMAGITFEEYLKNPETKRKAGIVRLFEAFSILTRLTESVLCMHKVGLAHQDLKPSNFLIATKDKQTIDSSHLSLFDLDTIYNANEVSPVAVRAESDGFTAPEVKQGIINHQTDIYSIAAILYYVLTDCKEAFCIEHYNKIEQIVKDSTLLKTTSFESKQEWIQQVIVFLQQNLCILPDRRAKSCEALLQTLQRLTETLLAAYKENEDESHSLFSLYADKHDQEDHLSQNLVIQNLLFQRPLYQYLSKKSQKLGKQRLFLVVVGLRENGKRFLNVALQAAQIPNVFTSVVIYYEESEDQEQPDQCYLEKENPLFQKFFEIAPPEKNIYDNIYDLDTDRYYGRVFFRKLPKTETGELDTEKMHIPLNDYYVFVDLEDDNTNKDIATKLANPDKNCCCSYVWYSTKKRSYLYEEQKQYLQPVCLRFGERKNYISPKLEALARNAHLIWESKPSDKELINDPYYFHSSVSYVLSIPYKLYTICSYHPEGSTSADIATAKEFAAYLSDPKNNDMLNLLVAYEHRRWIVEKITDGWTKIEPEEYYTEPDPNKNELAKRHCSLVLSSPVLCLSEEFYQKDHCRQWDAPISPSSTELDPLDQVSIQLHQEYKRRVKELTDGKSPNYYIAKITNCFPDGWNEDTILYHAFCSFASCFRSIWHGDRIYAREYGQHRNSFSAIIQQQIQDKQIRSALEGCLSQIDNVANAIQKSLQHKDFKKIDKDLLYNIPYIIANRQVDRLAMVLRDNLHMSDVYSNVISVSMLKPAVVEYVYCCCPDLGDSIAQVLKRKIESILRFFAENKISVTCRFHIAVPNTMSTAKEELYQLAEHFQDLEIQIIPCTDLTDGAQKLGELLNQIKQEHNQEFLVFDATTQLLETAFPTQFNDERFLFENVVKGYPGKKCNWPYFVLNWTGSPQNRFVRCNGCEELQFLCESNSNIYVHVKDLFSLNNVYYEPLQDEAGIGEICEELWKIYRAEDLKSKIPEPAVRFAKGRRRWNQFCTSIKKLENNNAHQLRKDTATDEQEKAMYFPWEFFKSVNKILQKLKQHDFASQDSQISFELDDFCRLYVKTCYPDAIDTAFDFIHRHNLYNPDAFSCTLNNTGALCLKMHWRWENVRCNSLSSDEWNALRTVLNLLEQKGYVYTPTTSSMLTENNAANAKANIAFASKSIYQVLTKEGELLENYVQHQLHKSGYFTDVVRGQVVQWLPDRRGITNEFDIIATKGLHSAFIECKGRGNVEQEVYFKIKKLTEYFGNKSICVVINTMNDSHRIEYNNTRAELMNIVNINDTDIEQVAEILNRLMQD